MGYLSGCWVNGADILYDWIKDKYEPVQIHRESISFGLGLMHRITFNYDRITKVDADPNGNILEQMGLCLEAALAHRIFIMGSKATVDGHEFDMASPTFFNDLEVYLGRG